MESIACEKCGRVMNEDNFYCYRNGTKMSICKKCLTMHINNFEPDTFLWILEKIDMPYVEGEWNIIRDKAYSKNKNLNGMSVIGKYISKMKLKQWKNFGWADTERIKEEIERIKESREAAEKSLMEDIAKRYEDGEISEAEYKTLSSTKSLYERDIQESIEELKQPVDENNFYDESKYVPQDEIPDLGAELTDEDKMYLLMKWGRLYTPSEWVELEKTYTEMMNSFDIQDADTLNSLLLICKTNLKMNQALDQGDLDGFQKLSRVSEGLRKSAKLTAAQNKEETDEFVDCIGNLVAYCEEKGGQIPKYDLKVDLDIVDKVINDMKKYTKGLIYEDKALAKQIEDYLKKREIMEQQKKDKQEAEKQGFDSVQLTDEDYQDFFESKIEDKKLDEEIYKGDE